MHPFAGTFYKVTNLNENHKGFQYVDGENILLEEFNDDVTSPCAPGGLYFTTREKLHNFLSFGVWIREVTLPYEDERFKVVADPSGDKFRANRIILGKRHSAYDADAFHALGLPISVYENNLSRIVDQIREEHLPHLHHIHGHLLKTNVGRQLLADRFWNFPQPPSDAVFQQLVRAGDFTVAHLRKASPHVEKDVVTDLLTRENPNVSALIYGREHVRSRADDLFCKMLDSKKADVGMLKLWAGWVRTPVRSLIVKRNVIAARRARRTDLLEYYSSVGKDITYVEKRWNKGSDGDSSDSDEEQWFQKLRGWS